MRREKKEGMRIEVRSRCMSKEKEIWGVKGGTLLEEGSEYILLG